MTSATLDDGRVRLDAHDALLPAGLLSLARVPLGIAFLASARRSRLAAAFLGLAALTDVLDGAIARRTHTATATGAVLDATADKAFLLSVVAALVRLHRMSPAELLLLASRELAEAPLVARYFKHRDDVHHVPTANVLGKATTTLQFAALVAALLKLRVKPLVLAAGATGVLAGLAYWRRALRDRG